MTALPAWKPDDVILGFRIQSELGRGGASRVYLAEDQNLKRPVALKVSQEASQEAAALGLLNHPGIVSLYSRLDVESQSVLVLEYVPGRPLADFLGHETSAALGQDPRADLLKGQKADARFIDRLMLEIALAIEHAHSRGVWHLDLKPENILLTEAGRPVLIDFNVARLPAAKASQGRTWQGGTLSYMSPEQLAAASGNAALKTHAGEEAFDHRADIYAFGAVYYELLTGEQLFPATAAESGFAVAAQEALAHRWDAGWLRTRLRKLTTPARVIIGKCLAPLSAKSPQPSRYRSAQELVEDLQDVLAGRDPAHARPSGWRRMVVRSLKSHRHGFGLLLAVVLTIGAVMGIEHWQISARLERVDREVAALLDDPGSLSPAAIPQAFDQWGELIQARALFETPTLKERRFQTEYRLGMAAIAGGQYERAIVLFERLLRTRPALGEAWHNLGIAKFRLKDYPGAIAAFSSALDHGADPAEALAARAAAYGAINKFASARPDIEKAIQLNPHSPAVKRQWELLNARRALEP